MNQQIQRYYQTNIEEAVAEADYSAEQMKQALSEFGYAHFPTNGITDKGFRTLMKRVSEIDNQESNLKQVGRKDLSSKVFEPSLKIKKEKNKKSNNYLSVVGEDLKKIEKPLGYAVMGPIMGFLALPTAARMDSEYKLEYPILMGILLNTLSLFYYTPVFFNPGADHKCAGIIAGIHLSSNLISGIYEYARHVKKRSESPINL